ncbi:MAG: hypothetical protein ABSC77_08275 [Terracidiphilus sp.]|jgi:hypothetical protein
MKTYVTASILIILALIAIACENLWPSQSWQFVYLTNFSSALLVSGLLTVLYRLLQEKQSDSTLRRLMRIHDSIDEMGLIEIEAHHQGYNFTNLIELSDHLVVVMNDGSRWVGNNTVALQVRFSKETLTEVFTVDPDSAFVDCLAHKTSLTVDDVRRRIHDTWNRLDQIYHQSEKSGRLKIYRLKTYPTRSLFLTENTLVETPYQIASGRINIPAFVYHKVDAPDCLYEFGKHDVDAMRKEAILEKEYGD